MEEEAEVMVRGSVAQAQSDPNDVLSGQTGSVAPPPAVTTPPAMPAPTEVEFIDDVDETARQDNASTTPTTVELDVLNAIQEAIGEAAQHD